MEYTPTDQNETGAVDDASSPTESDGPAELPVDIEEDDGGVAESETKDLGDGEDACAAPADLPEDEPSGDGHDLPEEGNVRVVEDNGYTFEIDEDTDTVTARGTIRRDPASRKGMEKITPDGYDSSVDDKGHLIAALIGGSPMEYNASAQNRTLNRSGYKIAENQEVRLTDEGYRVDTEKTKYVSHKGAKPDAYMVNDTITAPDGSEKHVYLSFQNASPAEQAEWERIADETTPQTIAELSDPLPENMTREQYEAYLDEVGDDSFKVKDEYRF